jgi:hypothetical protein
MMPTIQNIRETNRRRNDYTDKKRAAIDAAEEHISEFALNVVLSVINKRVTTEDVQRQLRAVASTVVSGTLATMKGGIYE